MTYDPTLRLNQALRLSDAPRLFEIYHENSKLSLESTPHPSSVAFSDVVRFLMTRGFRQYSTRFRVALPDALSSTVSLKEVMLRRRSAKNVSGNIDLPELSTLLEQSLGCTAVLHDTDSDLRHAVRAWPSAGGLYPLDAYVIARHVNDVPPGLYHYNPVAAELARLPSRTIDDISRHGFFAQPVAVTAALVVVLVACFARTVEKYGERGYRLVLLDAGHAAQNLLLVAEQLRIGAVAFGGYCDDSLASDLNIDGVSEAVVHVVLCGREP